MTVTTESGGRQNAFPNETRPYIDESVSYDGYPQNAEKVNGRWAMIGFVALLGAYVTTGQIIPGVVSGHHQIRHFQSFGKKQNKSMADLL